MHGTALAQAITSGSLLPAVMIVTGTALIVGALIYAVTSRPRSVSPDATLASQRLDAAVFLIVLLAAVLLIAIGTNTTQLAGAGSLIALVANVWFRRAHRPVRRTTTKFTVSAPGVTFDLTSETGEKDEAGQVS